MFNLRDIVLAQALGGGSSGGGGGGGGGGEEWIGDGNTHIWVSLEEGRASPMLGVGVNGTVTVDWGDGTTPDMLTGTETYTTQWTPAHNYATAGDYVISLSVDGEIWINGKTNGCALLVNSSNASDTKDHVYRNAIHRIEVGNRVTKFGGYAFYNCFALESVYVNEGVKSSANYAFWNCYNLKNIVLPDSLTSVGSAFFSECYTLENVTIPSGLTSNGDSMFYRCKNLKSVTIPSNTKTLGASSFKECYSLAFISIPAGVTNIAATVFEYCYGLAKIRFEGTTPPTVASSNAFNYLPTDCIISVPVGSLSAYTAATNYPSASTYTYVEE